MRTPRLSSWLAIIARNKAIDRVRTAHLCFARLDDPTTPDWPSDDSSPFVRLEQRERWCLARRALESLREEDRRFLEALYLCDVPPGELARRLGIDTVSVYTRRCKIQQKLARRIRRLCGR